MHAPLCAGHQVAELQQLLQDSEQELQATRTQVQQELDTMEQVRGALHLHPYEFSMKPSLSNTSDGGLYP